MSPAPTAGADSNAGEEEQVELSEAYVHSLASLGLERLQDEPGRLRSEAVAVDEALHTLSLDHYRVFIQNQECVRHVRKQGKEMETHLSSLLNEVQGLGAEFSVFQREAAELVGGHKRNRQTLKHHMQLVELLEVPQLMDACVRSDLLEEALSIATFASTLERRHRSRRASVVTPSRSDDGSDPASSGAKDDASQDHLPGVIRMIVEEVRESARSLHERLVAKLRGPIQLTSCLQVVSCLRRLELLALEERNEKKQRQQQRRQERQRALLAQQNSEGETGARHRSSLFNKGGKGQAAAATTTTTKIPVLDGGGVSQRQLDLVEMKLQVDFLEARDAWLADGASRVAGYSSGGAGGGNVQQALSAATAATSPYQALMDLIESSRSQWFEVATQFRAIFLSVEGGGGGGVPPTGSAPLSGGAKFAAAAAASPARSGRDSGNVLSLWLLRRVTAFVEQLKGLLPLVEDGGSLRSLLEECMFFGASMGRLGTDFRGLLVPIFEDRVTVGAARQWAAAAADFVVSLRDIAAIEAAGGNGSSLLHVPDKTVAASLGLGSDTGARGAGGVDGVGEAGGAVADVTLSSGDGVPPPPRSLMAFPPVARLVNVVLTSFNQLRECLPTSVEDRLADALVLSFTDVFRGLLDLKKTALRLSAAATSASKSGSPPASGGAPSWQGRTTGDSLDTTSRSVELACAALAESAVPHLALSFAALFGEYPATATAAATAAAARGRKVQGKAENLSARLLAALESFGIYEPPPAPTPAPPKSSAGATTARPTSVEVAASSVSPEATPAVAAAAAGAGAAPISATAASPPVMSVDGPGAALGGSEAGRVVGPGGKFPSPQQDKQGSS